MLPSFVEANKLPSNTQWIQKDEWIVSHVPDQLSKWIRSFKHAKLFQSVKGKSSDFSDCPANGRHENSEMVGLYEWENHKQDQESTCYLLKDSKQRISCHSQGWEHNI